jgi:hypothetical protein
MTGSKYTNKYIDNKLLENNILIKKIEIISSQNVKFQCLKCNYIWETTPYGVINGKNGCIKCAGRLKITNDVFDERIKNRTITRIQSLDKNIKIPIKFSCNICDYTWPASPDSIMNSKTDCPKCAGNIKITNSVLDDRIINIPIVRIGDVGKNVATPIDFMCKKCSHVWIAAPASIYCQKTGCPKCNKSLGEKAIRNILERNNIKFAQDYSIYVNGMIEGEHPKLVDFYLSEYNLYIEYNGRQHYEPVRFGGTSVEQAEINFQNQQIRDQQVRKFASMNNTEIYEIDYRKYSRKILRQRDLTFEEALEIDLYYHLNKIEEYWSMMGYHPDDRKHYDTFGMPDMNYFKSIING